jgi:hypothetical protein
MTVVFGIGGNTHYRFDLFLQFFCPLREPPMIRTASQLENRSTDAVVSPVRTAGNEYLIEIL